MDRIEAGVLGIRRAQDGINKKEEKRERLQNEAIAAGRRTWEREIEFLGRGTTAQVKAVRDILWAESALVVEMRELQREIDSIEDRCATLNTQEERDKVREMGRQMEARVVALGRRVDQWRVIAGAQWFSARGAWPASLSEAQDWGLVGRGFLLGE